MNDMDEMFERAVNRYHKDFDENPILAINALKDYLRVEEAENACILCTRECPVRNDGIINCDFRNDDHWRQPKPTTSYYRGTNPDWNSRGF